MRKHFVKVRLMSSTNFNLEILKNILKPTKLSNAFPHIFSVSKHFSYNEADISGGKKIRIGLCCSILGAGTYNCSA